MMSAQEKLSYLLKRYAANKCTAAEFEELFSLIKASGDQSEIFNGLKDIWESTSSHPAKREEEWERLYLTMNEKASKPTDSRSKLWWTFSAAASLLIISTIALLFYKGEKPAVPHIVNVKPAQELIPGGNKAILTLANGKKIILDGKNNGIIASQTGITISKTSNGQLIYQLSKVADQSVDQDAYNTIEVPKGGQYQVTMADGTKVWLNAMSSLKYPLNFKANERKIELDGEGYFEVAKNPKAPFRVQTRNQVVEVLGTHFNINAYRNEKAIRTTLLEGSVKVQSSGNGKTVLLSPGEQASLTDNLLGVKEIDVELAVAWKNGNFMFNKDNLENIMRQLARWYDVEIIYANEKVKNNLLSGTTSRFENASQVFDILELTGLVHFKVEGRRVIVM
ncbi:FecR family protein [Pedobacter mucosus]|uniref:FecR family protein n=1 Tax=Pedobacter mucosus TaxID=2895286 RepID=UPI001EE3C1A6|nr:FecR family protein [Pedobacter mucosus]UKT65953.1 FecR family protein [Pedobacter mucosus]